MHDHHDHHHHDHHHHHDVPVTVLLSHMAEHNHSHLHELEHVADHMEGEARAKVQEAVAAYAGDGSVAVMALQAGNDMVITGDYPTQIPKVIAAVEEGILSEEVIDTACRNVLAWKQALGLI